MKNTKEKIKEYIAYLNLGVKEGYFDEGTCEGLIEREDWDEVHRMMGEGDYGV